MHRIAFIAILAGAAGACATSGGGRGQMREYRIDEAIPLGPEASADVSIKAGPFELVRVLVRNAPTEKDVLEDTRKTDRSHPKPTIVARSTAEETAMVTLASILEDEHGEPLMTCSGRRAQELVGGVTDDWNTCFLEAIRTADWPRVKYFHAIVTFRVREEAAQAPQ
ncbi:MAG TPA: hypothetical protein VFG59_14130 [Anaeromyxobacter sp.]|nr:hypothetical protein [Anaeromyxobacter sp.]